MGNIRASMQEFWKEGHKEKVSIQPPEAWNSGGEAPTAAEENWQNITV